MTRHPDTAHDVHLEIVEPRLVIDLLKRLHIVDAHIVDQDVHLRNRGKNQRTPFRVSEITGDSLAVRTLCLPEALQRSGNGAFGSAMQDHSRPHAC